MASTAPAARESCKTIAWPGIDVDHRRSSAPISFTGLLQDGTAVGTGTLALAIAGSQPVTLTGASTYTGGTTVTGGTLIVNNTTGSATGTGAVRLLPAARWVVQVSSPVRLALPAASSRRVTALERLHWAAPRSTARPLTISSIRRASSAQASTISRKCSVTWHSPAP